MLGAVRGSFRAGVWSFVLAGCVLAPIDLADRGCPCTDGWVCDEARNRCVPVGDAGVSGDPCNALDDDADERIDEGPDLCGAPARATVECVSGTCVLTCAPGAADCNDTIQDGCEADLNDVTSCGACGVACTDPTPFCLDAGDGTFVCTDECEADRTVCGSSCVDLSTSVSHCGGCEQPCELRTGVLSQCIDGSCVYACAQGRADCDDERRDCETDVSTVAACGACNSPCVTEHTTPACVEAECEIRSCQEGWADCDLDAADGCETNLRTLDDCGTCHTPCGFDHATASCATGTCTMGACEPGFGDCTAAPGCETDLSLEASCGACGVTCEAGTSCDAGSCVSPSDVAEVVAGDAFACARIGDGRVACWGADESGQLGNGAASASTTAVLIDGITDAIDLAAGARHACAVRSTGEVLCWGDNDRRQLGLSGSGGDQPSPVAVRGLTSVVQVALGDEHSCVRRDDGTIACWGRNDRGQLGVGSAGGDRASPTNVPGLGNVFDLDAGDAHTCAVQSTGEIRCWGDNARGQLGDGTTTQRSSPTAVLGISVARSIALGADFTCAVATDGRAGCWGAGDAGQLGDGGTLDRAYADLVPGITTAGWIAAGDDHACVRLADGNAMCWGSNASGQLGDGTRVGGAPRLVGMLTEAAAVAAGASHTCAVREDGAAKCWGDGASGRLGDGGTADQLSPVTVLGLP
ncbi:Hypothetical protein I5071_75090 [Sandaracinus amylolyticus]|nr:Hypothetical protein I5071_75090 [Sandaracinus amylolyticus]